MKLAIILSFFLTSTLFAQTPDWRPINRVYKNDGVTVGSVGSAGQIKAGHVLTAKSFPSSVNSTNTAYWNLNGTGDSSSYAVNEFGVAAYDLTNNGTIPFTGNPNLWGVAGSASFNGSTQYFSTTNAFFDFGTSDSYTIGGWFYKANWTDALTCLFGTEYDASNRGLVLYAYTGGELGIVEAPTPAGDISYVFVKHGFTSPSWHHVVASFNATLGQLTLYIDGQPVGSSAFTRTTAMGTPYFSVGARSVGGSSKLTGLAQDVFFSKLAWTAQDVRRVYAARLDHNKNLIAKRQDWHFKHQHLGTVGNPYQTLPFVWHDSTDANSLFVDFSDLDATDKVDIRLYDLQQ